MLLFYFLLTINIIPSSSAVWIQKLHTAAYGLPTAAVDTVGRFLPCPEMVGQRKMQLKEGWKENSAGDLCHLQVT